MINEIKLKPAKIGDNTVNYEIDEIDDKFKQPALTVLDMVKNILEEQKPFDNETIEKNSGMMFVVLQALSYYPDVTGFADFFDRKIPLAAQYKAMFYVTPKQRRFEKWPKNNVDDTIVAAVSNYYKVSYRVAKMYMKLLNESDIAEIIEKESIGGMSGKPKKLTAKEKKAIDEKQQVSDESLKPKLNKSQPPKKEKKAVNKNCPIENNSMEKYFK